MKHNGDAEHLKEMSDADLAEEYVRAVNSAGAGPDWIADLEGEIRYRWLYEQGYGHDHGRR